LEAALVAHPARGRMVAPAAARAQRGAQGRPGPPL